MLCWRVVHVEWRALQRSYFIYDTVTQYRTMTARPDRRYLQRADVRSRAIVKCSRGDTHSQEQVLSLGVNQHHQLVVQLHV